MNNTLILILAWSPICLVAFWLGWELAISKFRRKRRLLETTVADLEVQVAAVNEQLRNDPQRAGIDMGKRYAINQVEATLHRLRQELPR